MVAVQADARTDRRTGEDADVITGVFVYGTLMPGQIRWPLLAPFSAGDPVRDAVAGRLLDTGRGYPALVDLGAPGTVTGYRIGLDPRRLEEALALLDAVEGVAAGLYERLAVDTAAGRRCWTYRYRPDPTGLADLGGVWR